MSRDELEGEVMYLRAEMGLSRDHTRAAKLRMALGLTAYQVAILLALYAARGRVLSFPHLVDVIGAESENALRTISVHVWRIRKLHGYDIVATFPRAGYAITPAGRELVERHLSEEVVGK